MTIIDSVFAWWLRVDVNKGDTMVYYDHSEHGLLWVPPQTLKGHPDIWRVRAVFVEEKSGAVGREIKVQIPRKARIITVTGGRHFLDAIAHGFEPYAITASEMPSMCEAVDIYYATEHGNQRVVFAHESEAHIMCKYIPEPFRPAMPIAFHPQHELVVAPAESEDSEDA